MMPAESVEYAAADAGTVSITFDGYYLYLDKYLLNSGWHVTKEDVKGDQIQLEFHSCHTKVEFKAEVDNGQVKLDVKSSPDYYEGYCKDEPMMPAESVEYAAADAGTVWITFDGYYLTFDNYVLNDGWYVTKQDVKSDQIQLEFHNTYTKVEFKAEVDNGQVKLEVKSSPDN
ncbi:MAG: hypothetical protein HKP18_09025 [Acidimicrobiia bacterium]|nr:hypothetical protein [Acidimicrobiia bacterium]